MAISFEKKSKSYLSFFLIIFLILIVSYFSWKYFFGKEEELPPDIAKKYSEIKINFDVLKNPKLKDLDLYEEIQPLKDGIGRENPYLPL